MLTKVEVRTAQGVLLVLTLDNISNGYVVEDILGLDPVKATLVSSTFANFDGAKYQSSRRETRNILFKLGLEPNYITASVRDLRTNLYSFFIPNTVVDLRFFMSDGLTVDIQGRVETFDAPLFMKEPKVDISILCFDPDFVGITPIVVNENTVSDLDDFTIPYEGTVETGIQFVLNVDRVLTEFTIYHRSADNILRTFDFAASLEADDILTINSVVGSKYITLSRLSTLSSLLYGKSPPSNWIELMPGDNEIRVYATGAPIPFSITYTPRHGGL